MRKLLLLLTAISCTFFACRKKYNPTSPTPDNYRITSYSLVTSQAIVYPYLSSAPVITENYSFSYDNNNRVSQVFYTSNDANKVNAGTAQLAIKYVYTNDTIYKISTNLRTTTVIEEDTFIINGLGQITYAYFPFETHAFSYYGKLLANENISYRDSGTVVSLGVSYTSNNNDFLYREFNGDVSVSFEDTGIRPDISPIDTYRDTVLSLPLDVTWTQFLNTGKTSTITHNGLTAYSDAITGYNENPLEVNAVDPNGVAVRSVTVPAGYCTQQFYQIYDYLTNRPGDYLELQSFTTYGINIYQETHMLKSITTPYFATTVTYNIDADSKVSTTSVAVKDSLLKNVTNMVYTIQWNTH